MPRYDTGLYQDTMGRLSDYVKQKLPPEVVEQITSTVDRNIFGGKVTLPKIVQFGQSLIGRTPEEQLMNFATPVAEIRGLYHGSPYKFNKFAQEKIGTGEGAQAFGYGHYLTESPEIAQSYAKPVVETTIQDPRKYYQAINVASELGVPIDSPKVQEFLWGENNMKHLFKEMWDTYGVAGEDTVKRQIRKAVPSDRVEYVMDMYDKMRKTGDIKLTQPFIYETTVNKGKPSSADVFLEWDKPVGKELIEKAKNDFGDAINMEWGNQKIPPKSGGDLYRNIARWLGSEEKASQYFRNQGITGIKYPSGTLSGIKGSPYYNYVIFNPEDITIEAVK